MCWAWSTPERAFFAIQVSMNSIWSCSGWVVNFWQLMQLNCELCNKYSRLLPQPERFNPTSHISHELQKFPFSVCPLPHCYNVISLLISPDTGLPFWMRAFLPCHLLLYLLPMSFSSSSLFTFPQGSGAAFFGDSLYPLFLSRAWASWPQKSISGPSETRLQLSLPPWNLGKSPRGPSVQTFHESALLYRILLFPAGSWSLVHVFLW